MWQQRERIVNAPIRTLLFSTLYPSSVRPLHGIFVETRLRELLKTGRVETRVVAPVPWFPWVHERWGDYANFARTPAREQRNGIDVLHPRYPLLPKIGMSTAPLLLATAVARTVRRLIDDGFDFDLIDAHYVYPDGVAAALLARWFNRTFVMTARGSDVNLIAEHAAPCRMIRWAADQAAASVCVSQALADRLMALGAQPGRVHVMRNGVDAERFSPIAQHDARARLGLDQGVLLLSVGNLAEVKRHGLVIDALHQLRQRYPEARLAVVGAGPLQVALQAQARSAGLSDAVIFAGSVDQADLRWWYSAADLLVLASSREGWPNVLLESMACGTPVVASNVGGVSEIVTGADLGTTVNIHSAAGLADAIDQTLSRRLNRSVVRQHALGMSWARTSDDQVALFTEICALGDHARFHQRAVSR